MNDTQPRDLRTGALPHGYLTVADLIRAAIDMRVALGACMVGAVAIGLAVCFLARPMYEANVVVIPSDSIGRTEGGSFPGQLAGLASLAGVRLPQSQDATAEALAVLQSRQFTESFIKDKNLLPVLFAGKWNAERHAWRVSGRRVPTLADGFRYFDRKIRAVSQDKKTGIVTLSIEWSDRNAAAAWANELLARLNAIMRQRALTEADASISVLQERLRAATVVSLQQALAQLLESQIRLRTVATVQNDYVFRIIDPAVPPDEGDVLFPRKLLIVALGGFAGLVISAILVFIRAMQRKQP